MQEKFRNQKNRKELRRSLVSMMKLWPEKKRHSLTRKREREKNGINWLTSNQKDKRETEKEKKGRLIGRSIERK